MPIHGQVRQKRLYLCGPHVFWVALVMKQDRPTRLINIRRLCANAVVARAQMVQQLWRKVEVEVEVAQSESPSAEF